jgi:alpha-L-arabinofuranosidase
MNKKSVTGAEGQNGLFASSVLDKNNNCYIIKVANTSSEAQDLTINLAGMKKSENLTSGKVITLSSADLDAENSIENPDKIVPVTSSISVSGQSLETSIAPNSFAVYILSK